MDEQFLTTEEVSYMMNISIQSVLRLIKENRLGAIKLSRSYRIPYSEIQSFKLREMKRLEDKK